MNTMTLPEFAALLRDPSQWPPGFEWSYYRCATCAMGLARRMGLVKNDHTVAMAAAFNMPHADARRIFLFTRAPWYAFWRDTSANDVARAIERYVRRANR